MTGQTITTSWQREFNLTKEWRQKLPTIWQMHKNFGIEVFQCINPLSPCGERTFVLAEPAICTSQSTNATPAQLFLSPAYASVSQLEDHARRYSVEILHALLQHQQNMQCA